MDYDRGLRMLKSQLETGQVLSLLTDLGSRKQNEVSYIGLSGAGTISDLGPMMQSHVARLYEMAEQENLSVTGELFCYYLSMDMKQGYFEFITCLPVKTGVVATGEFVAGTIPESETYVIEHKGEYQFLGNAWSYAMNLTRYNGIKVKTQPLGIVRYLDNPSDTDKADLLTEVILFKKWRAL